MDKLNKKDPNRTIRIIIVLFCCCMMPLQELFSKDIPFDSNLFFNASRFEFFEDNLTLQLNLEKRAETEKYLGIILASESDDNILRNIILNWEAGTSGQIIVMSGSKLLSCNFDSLFMSGEEQFIFKIDFKKDILTISSVTQTFTFDKLGFTVNNGYKFALIPAKTDKLTIINKEVTISQKKATKYPNWYWYVVIVVVDLLIFLGVHLSRRRKKKMVHKTPSERNDSLFAVTLPTKSAIYIFGTLQIYDKEGEEITKKFSPLIKELLSILIIYSRENGVSSEQLKELLWYDKSDSSARNNRAVNIGKLRTLLDTVGRYEIVNNNGAWFLTTEDVFIDYNEYRRIVAEPQPMTKNNFSLLMALTTRGILSSNSDYEWLDSYKSNVSETIIDCLIKYSHSLNSLNDADLLISIADTISRYDIASEYALYLKCRTLNETNRAYLAKAAYEKFCKEYKNLYNEEFGHSLSDVINNDRLTK